MLAICFLGDQPSWEDHRMTLKIKRNVAYYITFLLTFAGYSAHADTAYYWSPLNFAALGLVVLGAVFCYAGLHLNNKNRALPIIVPNLLLFGDTMFVSYLSTEMGFAEVIGLFVVLNFILGATFLIKMYCPRWILLLWTNFIWLVVGLFVLVCLMFR
jgi:hypothetical protein